jgi:hypothetical protein
MVVANERVSPVNTPQDRGPRKPNPLARFLGWLGDLIPSPPAETPDDPLLDGLDDLPAEEREARMRVWNAQFRRGRGDGNG